jgi:nicotinamide-nucleotide amidase
LSETLEPALPDHLDEQAERLMHTICDRELKLATAESCTGGMLAALLTDIEGCGHGFDRGFVTYSKSAKHELLGIDRDLLDHNDAVSEVVARAMAEGALARSGADLAVAITGVAGPAADEDGNPVGLVYLAIARRGAETSSQKQEFGDIGRGAVRYRSAMAALDLLDRTLSA